jgi:hypothetical protein
MKLNQNESLQNGNVKLKVAEVVNGFTAFGFSEEAAQLNAFLKGIGEVVESPNGQKEATFTP